jgi:hypothetical protein
VVNRKEKIAAPCKEGRHQRAYNDDLVRRVLSGKAGTPRPDAVIKNQKLVQNAEPQAWTDHIT